MYQIHWITVIKGFKIEGDLCGVKLTITDGFGIDFEFEILGDTKLADFYGYSDTSRTTMVAFVLDGGPKVASCVINDKLYNKGMHKLVEFN